MARADVECPTCNADVPLCGDEEPGDELFCVYCGAPSLFKAGEDGELELEEDF